jgi:transposase
MKIMILDIVNSSVKAGLKRKKVCSLLQIEERRIQRWYKRGQRLEDIPTGPSHAAHTLLDEEKEAIRNFALEEEYIDDSHRVLAAKGADEGLFYVSSSSVYKVMREVGLTTDRSDS